MTGRDGSIAQCPNCESFITTRDLTGRVKNVSGRVMVPVECPECRVPLNLNYTAAQWDRVRDHVSSVAKKESDRIGRIVAAFRLVDLAVVDTVGDIEPFWSIGPVPKEGAT